MDSVEELARFWDTHSLADFDEELEEDTETRFVRPPSVRIHLSAKEAEAVALMAAARGVESEDLLREWIREKLRQANVQT